MPLPFFDFPHPDLPEARSLDPEVVYHDPSDPDLLGPEPFRFFSALCGDEPSTPESLGHPFPELLLRGMMTSVSLARV